MDIVKKNIVSIIFGVVALVAMIASIWPLGSWNADLDKKVQERSRVASQLDTMLRRSRKLPIVALDPNQSQKELTKFPSEQIIESGRAARTKLQEESARILDVAVEMNKHDLIVPGSLPAPYQTEQYRFREEYKPAVDRLINDVLRAGAPPNAEDIRLAQQKLWQEKYANQIIVINGVATNSQEVKAAFDAEAATVPAKLRAQVAMTRGVYVNPDAFGLHPGITGAGAPPATSIWEAQLLYWIQHDVAHAIADANGAAPIAQAPVKHLIRLNLQPLFVVGGKPGEPNGPNSDPGPPLTNLSPTGRVSNRLYDVINFKIQLIVDAARMPEVLRAFSHDRFMNVTVVEVATVDPAVEATRGFMYGGGSPLVKIDAQCEAILFRKWTAPLMPKPVKTALGIPENPPPGA